MMENIPKQKTDRRERFTGWKNKDKDQNLFALYLKSLVVLGRIIDYGDWQERWEESGEVR